MKSAPVIIVQLIHIEGPMKGEIQEFSDPEISIGRHPSCHVQFPKDLVTISRQHAMIVRDGNRFKLVNQGPNGTFVNGKRIDEGYLKDGDVLTITEEGPKVSFLTEMREGGEIPLHHTPPAQSEPSDLAPRDQVKTPSRPARSEAPAPQVHQKPVAPRPHPEPPKPQGQQKSAAPQRREATREPRVQPKPAAHPSQPKPAAAQYQEEHIAPPPRQMPPAAQNVAIQRVQMPLVIQLGPTLRSFKEVPVIIGKSPECDFVLHHPEIIDHHAQIFFSNDRYWIKDLTGKQAVSINGQPVGVQAPLNPDDSLRLSASGPRFRFLGGGRLAEMEEPLHEEQVQDRPKDARHEDRTAFSPKDQADKVIKGAKNVLDKFLKR